MENRVTLSLPLLLPLSKKWNKTAHRTPPTDGKHCCLDESFSLPKSSSLFLWSWQVKKNVLLRCCACLSSGALKWCQNRLLITAVYCLASVRSFWSATSLLFTAICHKWCSTSTSAGDDNSGLNRDTGSIQLLWMFVFCHSTVMIEVELSMPGLCHETYLLSCLKNSVIWLHANRFFPNKDSGLPRWRFLTNCWKNRMQTKQRWLTEIWQRDNTEKNWQTNIDSSFILVLHFLALLQFSKMLTELHTLQSLKKDLK